MIREAWHRTLLEWEAVTHYYMPYALLGGRTFRNPLVERVLPGIMLVKSVAVFDEALESYIDSFHGGLPGGYRPVLDGRLRFLTDRGLLPNSADLHKIRLQRNALAHESEATATWEDVKRAIDALEAALLALGLVNPRPK